MGNPNLGAAGDTISQLVLTIDAKDIDFSENGGYGWQFTGPAGGIGGNGRVRSRITSFGGNVSMRMEGTGTEASSTTLYNQTNYTSIIDLQLTYTWDLVNDTMLMTANGSGNLAAGGIGTISYSNSFAQDLSGVVNLDGFRTYQQGQGTSYMQLDAVTIEAETSGIYTVDAGTITTESGNLSGTGGITKEGTGTLLLTGNNTYTGDTALEAGVIRAANGNALGTGSLIASNNTTFEVTNSITVTNDLSVYTVKFRNGGNTLSGTITNNNTVYDVAAGTTNTLSGLVTGTGGLELIGGGVLAVTGTTNSYTGNTTISNGTLRITTLADSNSVSSVGTSNNITLAGANATNAILDYTGSNVATDRTFVLTNGGGTINMTSSTTEMTLTGSASGAGTLIVGEGTLILSNTGTTNSFAPAAIQVDSGATLELAANDQIGNTTGLILNGGTFRVGTATTGFSDTLGTLTLNAASTIDLGAWTTGVRQLTFADSSAISWTGTLTITNWQGVANTSSDVAEILFGTAGLTSTQLSQVYWANQDVNGGALIGGGGELVPVPEARVVWGAMALAAFIGWRERRRCLSLLGQVFGRGRARR
jgi:fibronectin-binding autotransporter adhesin